MSDAGAIRAIAGRRHLRTDRSPIRSFFAEGRHIPRRGAEAALKRPDGLIREDETVDKWINFCMIEGDTILTEATAEVKRDIGRFQPR